jgi:histidinol-phosphate aminotransferase
MPDPTVRVPYMRAAVAAVAPSGRLTHAASLPRPVRALHLNECPLPPSPAVVEAIRVAASGVNRYPDAQARQLGTLLAERTGISADRIVFGTGSEELLNLATLIALDPGDEIVTSTPAFNRYVKAAQLAGGSAIKIQLQEDGRNDVKALVAAVTKRTRILFAALPNNPTGQMNDKAEIEELARTTPDDVLLLIDEAYYEFARHAGGPDVLAAMTKRSGPWMVLRTFSKAYCLAGLRLGYALCSSADVALALGRIKTAFNANVLVQAAAAAALQDEAHLRLVLETCATERRRLMEGCRALGLEPMPSVTNFVSIPVPIPAARVMAEMQERGILISVWGDGGRDDVIRISMGLADDTDAVLAALGNILGDALRQKAKP